MKHLFILLLLPVCGRAQNTDEPMPISGEYYLRGVPEVASGFRFEADSFQFFMIYGASDRFGKGSWKEEGDGIVLSSLPKPAPDFVLRETKTTGDGKLRILITDPNQMVLRSIYCRIETADTMLQGETDETGLILFDHPGAVKTIALLHAMWPNEPVPMAVSDPKADYFQFTLSPTIVEVEFKNLVLHRDGEALVGGHPLLQGDTFRYEPDH